MELIFEVYVPAVGSPSAVSDGRSSRHTTSASEGWAHTHQVPSVASSSTSVMRDPYLSALVFFALVQYTVDNFSSVKRRSSSHTQFPLGCSLHVLWLRSFRLFQSAVFFSFLCVHWIHPGPFFPAFFSWTPGWGVYVTSVLGPLVPFVTQRLTSFQAYLLNGSPFLHMKHSSPFLNF